MTEYHVTVHYSEPMLKTAVRTFVWHQIKRAFGWKLMLAFALVTFTLSTWLWRGGDDWLIGFLSALTLFLFLMPVLVYLAHMKNTLGHFRSMQSSQANFSFYDHDFCIKSSNGLAQLPWSNITELLELPDYWLFVLAPNQFITFPIKQADEKTLTHIRSKVTNR